MENEPSNIQNTMIWLGENEIELSQNAQVFKEVNLWLTSLFQAEHLALLTGNGLTKAVESLEKKDDSKDENSNKQEPSDWGKFNSEITEACNVLVGKAQRGTGNDEDKFHIAGELLRGLKILKSDDIMELETLIDKKLECFVSNICKTEGKIQKILDENLILCEFLLAFASRLGSRERLNIFTTNYDRVIEAGAEKAGLHLLDRFVGTLAPIFRSSRLNIDMHYNPPGIRGEPRYLEGVARFTKLHGSLDWFQDENGRDIRRLGIPFGVPDFKNYLKQLGSSLSAFQTMIYPNEAKDRETSFYPYAELFRDFAAAICQPNSVLVSYGWGFGDEHIIRIIEDMLTIPSTHLVMISYDDTFGRMKKLHDRKPKQTTLLLGNEIANIETLTHQVLPNAQNEILLTRLANIQVQHAQAQTREGDAQ